MSTFSIKDTIGYLLKDKIKNPKFTALSKIYRNWEKVVGEKYLNYCFPSKIVLDKEQKYGNLYVISYNPAVSFYLNNNKIFIIAKINTFFGYNAIQNIYVIEHPKNITFDFITKNKETLTKEQNDFVNSINQNKNDSLSESLRTLAKSFFEYKD